MTNGQLSTALSCAVAPLPSQEPTLPVAVNLGGVQQKDGGFAGLLGGIELMAKEKALPGSGQAEQPAAAVEDPSLDLLAMLQVTPPITAAEEPVMPKPEGSDKTDVRGDAVMLQSEPSVSQMVSAGYLPSGRMSEVNVQTLHIDTPQNVAPTTEEPAGVDVPLFSKQAELVTAAANPVISSQPVQSDRMSEANNPRALTVDMPQNMATTAEQPAVKLLDKQADQITAVLRSATPSKPVESADHIFGSELDVKTKTTLSQPAQSDRMSEAKNLTALSVDGLQKMAAQAAAEQPVLTIASPDKIQVKQLSVEPAQATQTQITTPTGNVLPEGAKVVDLKMVPAEKQAAVVNPKSESSAALTATSQPAPSPEAELEIQLSQPRPITARVTAAVRPEPGPDQQSQTVRTVNERAVAKEVTQPLQMQAAASEGLGSDTSSGKESSQGQSDVTYDNQMLAQDMRGQHKSASVNAVKGAPVELAQQNVPEQVMQQVKDRFVQHDVKQGSQQITLTLSPDNLGELKMNLNLQGQKLSVEIVTENRTVRDAIVLHADALKESLARQNITVESFDVTTNGKGSGNQGQNQNAWRELAKQQEQESWMAPRGYQTARADLPSGQRAYQRQQGEKMLDIHY